MLETGYRKPLSSLVMLDKAAIQKTLRAHVLLKVKPELDRVCEGLKTCGVMESTLQYPSLMAPHLYHSEFDWRYVNCCVDIVTESVCMCVCMEGES